jgi:hypothetical protein
MLCIRRKKITNVIRDSALLLSLAISLIVGPGRGNAETCKSVESTLVFIRGVEFILGHTPWRAKGATVNAFVRPQNLPRSELIQEMRKAWGEAELATAKADFGIDTVRFQVSQPAIDPEGEIYDSDYVKDVEKAVRTARCRGFVVILSPTAQSNSGLENQPTLPTEATVRVWQSLAPRFRDDKGVMFEIFNEPHFVTQVEYKKRWSDWLASYQGVIDAIRKTGSKNVVLIDALWYARDLSGPMMPRDPIGQLGYAVHPYLVEGFDSIDVWHRSFGNRARISPLIATEWNGGDDFCVDGMPEKEALLLQYLNLLGRHGIGLIAWSLDHPETLYHADGHSLTSYTDFRDCRHKVGYGGGEIFSRWKP